MAPRPRCGANEGDGASWSGGGKAVALGHRESVAAEDDGYVVMPARVAAALEVVEAEFALEVFVGALGTPALHGEANEFFEGRVVGQGGEEEIGGVRITVAPLDKEPDGLAFCGLRHGLVARRLRLRWLFDGC